MEGRRMKNKAVATRALIFSFVPLAFFVLLILYGFFSSFEPFRSFSAVLFPLSLLAFFFFGSIFGFFGILYGIIALVRSRKFKGEGKKEAITAFVASLVSVLIILLVASYFGMFHQPEGVNERCQFPASFYCTDFDVTSKSISLTFQNDGGKDMVLSSIVATSDAVNGSCIFYSAVTLPNGEKNTFSLANCNYVDSGRDKNLYHLNVTYSWADSPTISHQLVGELLAKRP
jgi:hypothetical protein